MNKFFKIEIVVDHKNSLLDDMIMGKPPTKTFGGSITRREPIIDSMPSIGSGRDAAIGYFRRAYGWSGAIDRCSEISKMEFMTMLSERRGSQKKLRYLEVLNEESRSNENLDR